MPYATKRNRIHLLDIPDPKVEVRFSNSRPCEDLLGETESQLLRNMMIIYDFRWLEP